MFDWNDLKYFLAIARHHSTIAAGKALGLSQSTVQRRLTELERAIGQPLVKRHPSGYRLTKFGEDLMPYAERIEATVIDFERRVTDALGLEVTIDNRGEAGVVHVRYRSLDQLDEVVRKLERKG